MTSTRLGTAKGGRRASVARRLAVVALAGVTTIGVGVGMAHAEGDSPRAKALRAAAVTASSMPSEKGRLYTAGVARAFPSQMAHKPVQAPAGPVAAPGVRDASVPDSRVPGISSLRQAPFAPVDFAVDNSYSAKIKGRWYIAYAGTIGGDGPDRGRGGIRVMSADPGANTDIRELGTFPATGTTGLAVTASSGTAITLVSTTGSTFTFDLSTLSYR